MAKLGWEMEREALKLVLISLSLQKTMQYAVPDSGAFFLSFDTLPHPSLPSIAGDAATRYDCAVPSGSTSLPNLSQRRMLVAKGSVTKTMSLKSV